MLYQIIKWVYYDMFGMIRTCMQNISFGDYSLYDFLISALVVYLLFTLAKRILLPGGDLNK